VAPPTTTTTGGPSESSVVIHNVFPDVGQAKGIRVVFDTATVAVDLRLEYPQPPTDPAYMPPPYQVCGIDSLDGPDLAATCQPTRLGGPDTPLPASHAGAGFTVERQASSDTSGGPIVDLRFTFTAARRAIELLLPAVGASTSTTYGGDYAPHIEFSPYHIGTAVATLSWDNNAANASLDIRSGAPCCPPSPVIASQSSNLTGPRRLEVSGQIKTPTEAFVSIWTGSDSPPQPSLEHAVLAVEYP